MYAFSKQTLDSLRHAGWYEGRECEQFDEYKRILNQEEFELSDTIEQFLKSFGGLLVKHPHAKVHDVIDYFHCDVVKAINGSDPNWVSADYSERVGEPLCIIGEAFRRNMVLSMSPTGKVYAGVDDFLICVGASGEDAIEALCTGRELEKVPELATTDDDIEVTVELLNDFFQNKRIRKTFHFINEQGTDSIHRQHWLEVEFAAFLSQNYDGLKWQKLRQTSPDIFDFTFIASGKQYAIALEQYQPTQSCLKNMIKDWTVRNTQSIDQVGDGVLAIIGLHPKMDMQDADIKSYMLKEAQKEGLKMNKDNIKTTFIPDTDYAFTVSTVALP
jgi:hypothetical protein